MLKHYPAPGWCTAPVASGRWGWRGALTQLLGHVATRGKRHSKERQKPCRNYFSIFLGQIKNQVTRGHQRSNFAFPTFFEKSAHNSKARPHPLKSALDISFNALSVCVPRLTLSKTNGLASIEYKLKNTFLQNNTFYSIITFDSKKERHLFCQHRVFINKLVN